MGAFLDTTAMVDLLFKNKAVVDRVRGATAELGTTYTSQYVRMEIKRGVLQNFVLIYNKSVECRMISEIFAYVQRLSATPARHRTSTILEAITNFFASIEENELAGHRQNLPVSFSKRMVEAFLRTRIRRFWVEFERQVDVVIDSVECYKNVYQLPAPKFVGTRIDNTFENCDQYKPQICVVRQFLRERREELTSIRDRLKNDPSPDEETQKRWKAIKNFVRWQGKREVRRTDCWHMGDAIIALEAPNQTAIVNNNRRHMDLICSAIRKTSLGY
ncbi:MAG: hypothetical protein LAP13_20875 [Acidobacteriia bacterium]|nr:hypothetical protein [Terriglobia bacterium]